MIFRCTGRGRYSTAAESNGCILFHTVKGTMKTLEKSPLHQKWSKNVEIFLTFTDYRNLIHSFQKKKLQVNAIKHTQVTILLIKFHNPVTGKKQLMCFMKQQEKIQAIKTYATLGLFNRAAGVRKA